MTVQDLPASARAHAVYEREFLELILALAPASLLDVGCGQGQLLATPELDGVRRVGVEVQAGQVERLRQAGLDARLGRAETLPFADDTFDVVVFQYTAHHVADLPGGLREAARVARRAVLVLDPWYDVTLPSQRIARDYDEWSKTIDRLTGMVHNACPTAADLAAPFADLGDFALEVTHRLILRPLDVDALAQGAQAHLATVGDRPALATALAGILAAARSDGVSDDGAILFSATRLG